MLTIQPGIIFNKFAVQFMRSAGLTDDDVANHIANFQRGDIAPIQFIQRNNHHTGVTCYVRGLCCAADIDLSGNAR
jgi:hypothetical protein